MNVINDTDKQIVCESCGNDFICEAQAGVCWCFNVSLKADILIEIQKKYKNCLCAGCLKSVSEILLAKQTPAKNF